MAERRRSPLSPEQEAVATELYQLREGRDISQASAAKACKMAGPRLSEIESAVRPPDRDELTALLKYYEVSSTTRRRLCDLLSRRLEESDSWWLPKNGWVENDSSYAYVMRAENRSSAVFTAQGQYIPALLQTRRYARELLVNLGTSEQGVQQGTEVRLGRQAEFFKRDGKGRLHVVLAESLLDTGPRDIVVEQLCHLLERVERKFVEIRIVPKERIFPVLGFTLIGFSFDHHVGYIDGPYDSMDVVKMRETDKLKALKERQESYIGAALSPEQSLDIIEKHIATNRKES